MISAALQDMVDNSLARYVCSIHLTLARALARQLQQAGIDLTTDQCRVLFVLFFHNGCTQQELGRILLQDKSGVSRLLHSLERKGHVERLPSPSDERHKHVRLTEKGWGMQQPCLQCVQAVQDPMLEQFPAEEQQQLFSLLRKLMLIVSDECAPGCTAQQAQN